MIPKVPRTKHGEPQLPPLHTDSPLQDSPLPLGPWMGNEITGKWGEGVWFPFLSERYIPTFDPRYARSRTNITTSQHHNNTIWERHNVQVHQRLEVITEFHSASWENESAFLPALFPSPIKSVDSNLCPLLSCLPPTSSHLPSLILPSRHSNGRPPLGISGGIHKSPTHQRH